MSIRAAGSFKTGVAVFETVIKFQGPRFAKCFIRSPASGDKALVRKHVEGVFCRAKMFFAVQSEICLHRRTEGVDVAVSVSAGQDIPPLGERVVVRVEQVLPAKLPIPFAGSTLIRQEEIF